MYPFPYYLAATPSALEGVARILDVGNTFTRYNISSSGEIADAIAIAQDWDFVERDMSIAAAQIKQELLGQSNGSKAQQKR